MRFLGAILGALIATSAASAASFDCSSPRLANVERLVCADASISASDSELQSVYRNARQRDPSVSLIQSQREWLKTRNACADASCLRQAYADRITVLKTALEVQSNGETEVIADGNVSAANSDLTPIEPPSSAEATATEAEAAPAVAADNTQQNTSSEQAPDVGNKNVSQNSEENIGNIAIVIGIILLCIVALAIWLLPTIIAFKRGHAYKWIILVISILGPLWLVALVWAIFPSDKSIIDPVVGNVTGLGQRNAGDTIGAAKFGAERGYSDDARSAGAPEALNATAMEKLERLAELYKRGALNEEEFSREKERLLSRI